MKIILLFCFALVMFMPMGFSQVEEDCGSGTAHIEDRRYTDFNCNYHSWSFEKHNIPQAWAMSQGQGITVGVIDEYISQNFVDDFKTGTHSSIRSIKSYDLGPCENEYSDECSSHATKVSGIIAGPKLNDGGAYGIAYKADLVHYRALSKSGLGCVANVVIGCPCEGDAVVNALHHAKENGVNIINMSIGTQDELASDGGFFGVGGPDLDNITAKMKEAYESGVIMFAAGGSLNTVLPVTFPGNSKFTLGVTGENSNGLTDGAVNAGLHGDLCTEGTTSKGCHHGPEIDFSVQMISSNNRYPVTYAGQYFGLTSTATAHMSGMTALLWSKYPTWSKERVINQLILNSSNYPNKDDNFGWGRVDIYKAMREKLANETSTNYDRLIIERISLPGIDDTFFGPDDNWVVKMNGKTFIFDRDDNRLAGVPSMLTREISYEDCFSPIMEFGNTNTLNIQIWKEGDPNCIYNGDQIVDDSGYFSTVINLDPNLSEEGFVVPYESENNEILNFFFNYKRYDSSSLDDAPAYNPGTFNCPSHSHIEFFDELGGTGNSICAADIEDGTTISFSDGTNVSSGCLNDKAKSAKIYNVSAGTVIKLLRDENDFTQALEFIIRESSWLEIIAKQDIDEYTVSSFNASDEDDFVKVTYHRNHNDQLNGEVSQYISNRVVSGPVIDFYDDVNAGGSLQCSVNLKLRASINFAEVNGKPHYPECDNDEISSAILYDMPAGMTISLFDRTEDDNPLSDDWVEVFIKRNFKKRTINTFEVVNGGNPYEDDDLLITYHIQDGELNNKISFLTTAIDCSENPLMVEIDSSEVLNCIGSGSATLDALVEGGSPPFKYTWKKASDPDFYETTSSIDVESPGLYTLEVDESRNCLPKFDDYLMEPVLQLDSRITLATCNQADGKIRVDVDGSNPPYTYEWDNLANNQTTRTATNLAQGSYTVTVTDNTSCSESKTFEVEENFNFRVTTRKKNPSNCMVNDGWAEVIVSGLVGDPQYLWSYQNRTTSRIENLGPGTYTVLIIDSATTCATEKSITIFPAGVSIQGGGTRVFCEGQNPQANLTASRSNCNDCTYKWSNGSDEKTIMVTDEGAYSVTVVDALGCEYIRSTNLNYRIKDCSPDESIVDNDSSNPPGGNGDGDNISNGSGDCGFWDFIASLLGFSDCTSWGFPVLHAFDPNDIAGNIGYDKEMEEDHWVSIDETLSYMIRFENDPEFATGPAQIVEIRHPLDSKLNPYSFRLNSFGFGNFLFEVPDNAATVNQRLDVQDSLGVYVDIIGGVDVINNEAFWIFKSIDPATGQLPLDGSLGFLSVTDTTTTRFNDTIPKLSEGFVSFTLLPLQTDITTDTINATASIIFDDNAPIETNVWKNTIDAFPPVSTMEALVKSASIELSWTAEDDIYGVGVKDYSLYYAVNEGPFLLYDSEISDTSYNFPTESGNTYQFFTLARDWVHNEEAMKSEGDINIQYEHCSGDNNDTDVCLDENITLYSNPIEGAFQIKGALDDYFIRIMNDDGSLFRFEQASGGSHYINLNDLPPGQYHVSILHNENPVLSLEKIIKS